MMVVEGSVGAVIIPSSFATWSRVLAFPVAILPVMTAATFALKSFPCASALDCVEAAICRYAPTLHFAATRFVAPSDHAWTQTTHSVLHAS